MGQVFLNDLENFDDVFSNQRDDKTRNPDILGTNDSGKVLLTHDAVVMSRE